MNIAGWMADWSGCGFYRIAMPGAELRRRGHSVMVTNHLLNQQSPTRVIEQALTALARPETESRQLDADVIIGQRIHMPGPSKLWQTIAQHQLRPKLVFEIDDDLFNVDPSSVGAYRQYSQPDAQLRLIENAKAADLITVSTHHLKRLMVEVTGKDLQQVMVVPNTVPSSLVHRERIKRQYLADRVTIGWAGSPTHEMDWRVMASQVGRFVCSRTDVEFHVIGAPYRLAVPLNQYRHSTWRSTVPAYWQSIDFDIGLAPLKDHPFNHSKSHIKALEYAALGIPIIASDVGPYHNFVRHGLTGFLVPPDKPELWQDYLHTLVSDPQLRRDMGLNAKEQACQYTIEEWAGVWELALS